MIACRFVLAALLAGILFGAAMGKLAARFSHVSFSDSVLSQLKEAGK